MLFFFSILQDHEEIFDTVQLLSESVSKIFSAANAVRRSLLISFFILFYGTYLDMV
jgi:hypothetical protein